MISSNWNNNYTSRVSIKISVDVCGKEVQKRVRKFNIRDENNPKAGKLKIFALGMQDLKVLGLKEIRDIDRSCVH